MSSISSNPSEFLWEQKYRPQTLAEVIIPTSIREKIDSYIVEGRCPSFLFFSPSPGTGKTTTAKAIAKDVGCPMPLFINASLDNNIETIRAKVVQYATTTTVFANQKIKIVILDECERLSQAAQESLKGIMEQVSKNCSFILTTNSKARIVNPLVSRCRNIDFIWSKEEGDQLKVKMCHRITEILKVEGVAFDPKAVMAVVQRFYPDNRRMIGVLQDYSQQHGKVDINIVNSFGGTEIEQLVHILKEKDFNKMTQFVMDNLDSLGADFYGKFFRYVYPDVRTVAAGVGPKINKEGVPDLVDLLGEEQKFHATAPDPFVHLVRVMTLIMVNPSIRFL